MARIPPPRSHPTRCWRTFTITHLSSTEPSPLTRALGRLLIGFIPSDTFNQSGLLADRRCDYHHEAIWLRAVWFWNKRHMHTRRRKHACAQKHACRVMIPAVSWYTSPWKRMLTCISQWRHALSAESDGILTSGDVYTPTDRCMLWAAHREISGLCMLVRDLHWNDYYCILYMICLEALYKSFFFLIQFKHIISCEENSFPWFH